MSKRFNPEHPIVVGLLGEAATGKTVVGRGFVPYASSSHVYLNDPNDDEEEARLVVEHLWFAMPLYEMAAVKTKTEGEKRKQRQLYGTYEVLFDLFGRSPLYGLPKFDTMVELTKEIAALPIAADGKPRTFLQTAGTMCRDLDEDVFVKWMDRKIKANAARYIEMVVPHLTFISDVRMVNEAKWIADQPNGVLIKFSCDDEVRAERIEKRDGKRMTAEQLSHESELSVKMIPKKIIDTTIDSTDLTVQEQAAATTEFINDLFDTTLF